MEGYFYIPNKTPLYYMKAKVVYWHHYDILYPDWLYENYQTHGNGD